MPIDRLSLELPSAEDEPFWARWPQWLHGLGVAVLLAGALLLFGWGTGLIAVAAVMAAAAMVVLAAVVLWAMFRRDAGNMLNGEFMLAALEAQSSAICVTDIDGDLIAANAAYGRLLAGYPSPLRLGDAGMAAALARDARVCGRGEAQLEVQLGATNQLVTVTARRTRSLPDILIWEVAKSGSHGLLDATVAPCKAFAGPWLDRLHVALLVIDDQEQPVYANDKFIEWCGRAQNVASWPVLSSLISLRPGQGACLNRTDGTVLPVEMDEIPLGAPISGNEQDVTVGGLGTVLLLRRRSEAGQMVATGGEDRAPIAEQIFAEAPVGVAQVDAAGGVLRANKAFRRLAGISDNESDFELADYLVETDREAASRLITGAAEKGQAKLPPQDVRFKSAPDSAAQMIARPLRNAKGGAMVYIRDKTEQKRLELQFAQAQKMQAVGQLAGGIAHDFNNILTAVIGFCDLLLVRHGAGDASFSDIMQIKQNANRAANLVRQLLAFSRKQTLRPSVIDITEVLAELSNLLRRLIGENIQLKMVHGRNIAPVLVDQGQLEQVITNLVVNARDAMRGGGTLNITTANIKPEDCANLGYEMMPAGEYVLIEVRDTGHGINDEILEKIFEPFFTTKEVGQGTGLGLSTVYGIVKQTGGFIFAESKPAQGAAFKIYLPVHHETKTAKRRAPKADLKSEPVADLWGRGTILLVEDETPVRTFAHRALAKKGYTVIEAESGEDALQKLSQHDGDIDLVVSDVIMPNMDGPSLVQKLREGRPDIKVIFISGYAQDNFRDRVGDGQYGFLPKPFSLNQLAQAVKAALEKPESGS